MILQLFLSSITLLLIFINKHVKCLNSKFNNYLSRFNCAQFNCVIYLCHLIQTMKDPLHISQQVCFPVYAFAKEIVNQYRPLLDALGLTYPQYLVMLVLWEHESQTVNQLGEKVQLDSGTLTPLLKRMESKLLISRIRSTTDERIVNISLTDNGKALKEKAACIPGQLMEAMGVSEEELLQLKNIITKISKK